MRQIVSDYLENQDASLLDDMTSEEQRCVSNQDPTAKKAAEKAVKEADAKASPAPVDSVKDKGKE